MRRCNGLAIFQPYYVSNQRVLRDRSNDRPVMLNSANARVAIGGAFIIDQLQLGQLYQIESNVNLGEAAHENAW